MSICIRVMVVFVLRCVNEVTAICQFIFTHIILHYVFFLYIYIERERACQILYVVFKVKYMNSGHSLVGAKRKRIIHILRHKVLHITFILNL